MASITHQAKYNVFISFRGEDTRDSFTSHLYAALCRKQVKTFIDVVGLKKGDEISPVLLKAIEDSKISVIIFSEDYASSRWCLEELEKIIECKHKHGQMVVPVFYHVNARDVQMQSGSYEKAFVKHEERLKGTPEKVEKWRFALSEAAKLPRLDTSVTKPESKLVEEVAAEILKKLNYISSSTNCEGLIGIDSRIDKIRSLLCIGSLDFEVVGIWGMGGIGKTTIAGAVFNEMYSQFEGYCFCVNIREESEKRGIIHLRDNVLSQILEENIRIGTPRIPQYIKERLQRKKVLIVLDDVNDFEQLELLAGGLDRFGPGSRIIITTRNKQLLYSYGVHNIYEVERFNDNEALQFFCTYAFKQNHPPVDLVETSNKVLAYAEGNPLALKVLSSSLYRKNKQDWERVLHKFRLIPNPKIHDVLKISYDGLDREEKDLFLDIACFFKGEDRDEVAQILDGCYAFYFSLSNLVNKSLITTSDNKLYMHDLLQEMGQQIVCQESEKEPGKRSRLWYHEDVHRILKNNKGTHSVEGIFLDMSKIRDLQLCSEAFVKMYNLRLLKFHTPKLYKVFVDISKLHLQFVDFSKVCLPRGLKYLPDELRYLHWDGYPFKTLPSNFSMENLVELKLPCSKIEKLWKGKKQASRLKLIDLRNSQCLTRIPDLSDASVLEVINLRYCKRIRNFPQISGSIKQLDLSGTNIEEIPTSICELKSLFRLKLWDCSKLESFPKILEKMERLQYLWLARVPAITELPSSVEHLNGLRELGLVDCKNLKEIPSNLCGLTSLQTVDISGCSKLDKLPKNLGNLMKLRTLHAKGIAIKELPSSLAGCRELGVLNLSTCKGLVLGTFPALCSLTQLNLSLCNLTKIPEELCLISSLEILNLSGNSFESLPTRINKLSQLKRLWISNCKMIQSLPELPPYLVYFEARNCKRLHSLPELPSSLEELSTSELEIVSERCRPFAFARIEFVFTNCVKLKENVHNNVLADSKLRIQHMATASLRLCYEKVFDKTPSTSFCLPGSEIPDWFIYQSSGSSVTVGLPQHWYSGRFIGFALCTVIAFEGSYCGRGLYVGCSYQFQTNNSNRDRNIFGMNLSVAGRWPITFIDSEHIVLGYSPVRLLSEDYTTASFKFSLSRYGSRLPIRGCRIKCCGVCPLYTQPNGIQPSISIKNVAPEIIQDYVETLGEEHTKIRKRGDEYCYNDQAGTSGNGSGRMEPGAKRIRR